MALSFERIKNLTAGTGQNIAPLYVHTPCMVHEPDSSLFQYYIKPSTNEAWDKRATVDLGQYSTLPWADNQRHLTTRAVSKIGAKQFPQIGAIGFYKDLYTSQSYILAPVHNKQKTFDPPSLSATLSGSAVKLSITPPKNTSYSCYKVIMRSGYFAVEYVVYNLTASVAKPLVNGVYSVTAIGYNELTGAYSSPSNAVSITVTDGSDTWEPEAFKVYLKLGDLADVNLVDLLNAQMLRFNAATHKWENVSANRVVEVTLLASAWTATDIPNNYTQTIEVEGVTKTSKIDLQPSDEQIILLHERAVNFSATNIDGVVVARAVGDKPIHDYFMQATVTEVTV